MFRICFLAVALNCFFISLVFGYSNITPDSFIDQNDTVERRAITKFIVEQFNDTPLNSVSQSDIDKLWSDESLRQSTCLGRFQIVDQKLYSDSFNLKSRYFRGMLDHFAEVVSKYKVNDVDFIVLLRDEVPQVEGIEKIKHFPLFVMSKNLDNEYEKDKFLLPDVFMVEKSWPKLIKDIDNTKHLYPWDKKIEKIYWRGGATGSMNMGYNLETYDKLPRITIVSLSRSYPDLIDAKMVGLFEFQNNESSQQLNYIFRILFGGDSPKVREVDHMHFKYLAAIDGNTCTWKRVPWIMLSNSVLVKQETDNIEWFYSAIKPYEHYIPINSRLTDIFQKLEWMKSHDDEVRAISMRAQNFVKNNLMPEDIMAHTAIILNEYSKIQKNTKINVTTRPFEECKKYSENIQKASKIQEFILTPIVKFLHLFN